MMSSKFTRAVLLFVLAYLAEQLLNLFALPIPPELLVVLFILLGLIALANSDDETEIKEEAHEKFRTELIYRINSLSRTLRERFRDVEFYRQQLLNAIEASSDNKKYRSLLRRLAEVEGKIKDALSGLDGIREPIAYLDMSELNIRKHDIVDAETNVLNEIREQLLQIHIEIYGDEKLLIAQQRLSMREEADDSAVPSNSTHGGEDNDESDSKGLTNKS